MPTRQSQSKASSTEQTLHTVKLLWASGYKGKAKKRLRQVFAHVQQKCDSSIVFETSQLSKVYSVAENDISNAVFSSDYFVLYVPKDISRHAEAVKQANVAFASSVPVILLLDVNLSSVQADGRLLQRLGDATHGKPAPVYLTNTEQLDIADEILSRCVVRRREQLPSLIEESLECAKDAASKYFLGTRSTLFHWIQAWASRPMTSGSHKCVALLSGEAFLGKTVALAQACHSSGIFTVPQRRASSSSNPQADYSAQCINPLYQPFNGVVGAAFFCPDSTSGGFDARECLLVIAEQLATFIGGSYQRMLRRAHKRVQFLDIMAKWPLEKLFRTLLLEPLERISAPVVRILVVIDGIDRCRESQRDGFFDLVFRQWRKLPKWLSLLCSSRPVRGVSPFAYDLTSCELMRVSVQEQLQDAQTFAYDKLYSLMPNSSHLMSRSVELVCDHTGFSLHCLDVLQYYMMSNMQDGEDLNYLQLKRLVEHHKYSTMIYDSLYTALLKLMVDMGPANYHALIDPLAVSREPVPLVLFENALDEEIRAVGQNLVIVDFDAQTVELPLPARARRFLTKRKHKVSRPAVFVQKQTAHAMTARWCRSQPFHRYALRNALFHLSHADMSQHATTLLNDFDWLTQALTVSSPSHMANDILSLQKLQAHAKNALALARVLQQSEQALERDPREIVSQCYAHLPASHPLLEGTNVTSLCSLRTFSSGRTPFLLPVHSFVAPEDTEIRAVAIGKEHIVSGRSDCVVCVHDILTGNLKRMLSGHSEQVISVAITHDLVVSGSRDKTARVWSLDQGALVHELQHVDWVLNLQMSSTERVLIALTAPTLYCWDVREGTVLRMISNGRWDRFDVASATLGIASSLSNEVKLWEISDNGEPVEKFEMQLTSKLFNWAQDLIVTEEDLICCTSFDIFIWSTRDGRLRHKMTKTGHFNNQLYIDDRFIVSLERRQPALRVWSRVSGQDLTDDIDLQEFRGDLPLLLTGVTNKSSQLPFDGVGFSTRTTAYQHLSYLAAPRWIAGKVVRPGVVVESSGRVTILHCEASRESTRISRNILSDLDQHIPQTV